MKGVVAIGTAVGGTGAEAVAFGPGERVVVVLGVDPQVVTAQHIVAGLAVERVVAGAAAEVVGAEVAEQRQREQRLAGVELQCVVGVQLETRVAPDRVVGTVALDLIGAAATGDVVGAFERRYGERRLVAVGRQVEHAGGEAEVQVAPETVIAGFAHQHVGRAATGDEVGAVAAQNRVRIVATGQDVVAGIAPHQVGTRAAFHHVIAGVAGHGVVAGLAL